MNKLSKEKQIEIVKCLTEGMSLRATSRITETARNTVSKLLLEIGEACEKYHAENVVNLQTKKVQVDEIWSFVGAKEKNVPSDRKGTGVGSVWTWTAIDADSKLIISYAVGNRDAETALSFMKDVKSRLAKRVQLTSDGFNVYRAAVEIAFQGEVDFAQLVKIYGEPTGEQKRYSPAECTGCLKTPITGRPNPKDVSTSYVERSNLTMRMQMRRFTRLTNAFSKKMEFHVAAIALHFMYYNFVKSHATLNNATPAMVVGLSKSFWSVADLVDLLGK